MVFVWHGAGIIVPIALLISGWLVSYSFEDTRLGNTLYMGWTMFWPGLVFFILGGLVVLGGKGEAHAGQEGETESPGKHDFFFIPVWIWGGIFTALAVYFIWVKDYDDLPEIYDTPEHTAIINEQPPTPKRVIHFYNNTGDSLKYLIGSLEETVDEAIVAPGRSVVGACQEGDYIIGLLDMQGEVVRYYPTAKDRDAQPDLHVQVDDGEGEVLLRKIGPGTEKALDWDEAWFPFESSQDFALVNIMVCYEGLKFDSVKYEDWTQHIHSTYDGTGLVEPLYNVDTGEANIRIFGPNQKTPDKSNKGDVIYILVGYPHGTTVTSEQIANQLIEQW